MLLLLRSLWWLLVFWSDRLWSRLSRSSVVAPAVAHVELQSQTNYIGTPPIHVVLCPCLPATKALQHAHTP